MKVLDWTRSSIIKQQLMLHARDSTRFYSTSTY